MSVLHDIMLGFSAFVLIYYLCFIAINTVLVVISAIGIARRPRGGAPTDLDRAGNSPITPKVSVIVPAFNEQACIVGSARSLLDITYLRREVIIVDDGSSDATFERLHDAFDLVEVPIGDGLPLETAEVYGLHVSRDHPDLWVVRKANGGRSDALNVALNFARGDLVCAIDADSVLEPDALAKVVQPFVDDPVGTVAVGGIVRIANGSTFNGGRLEEPHVSTKAIPGFQTLEYLRGFLAGRIAWAHLNALLIVSGAFGVFRRDVIIRSGGFSTTTMGEDMELIVRMHRHLRPNWPGFRVAFVPDAVCWTEAPERLRDLRGQRIRWHVGLIEILTRHRELLFHSRSGVVTSWLSLPYLYAFELAGPIIEALGYVVMVVGLALGFFQLPFALAFGVVAIFAGVLLSVSGLLLEEVGFRRYPKLRDLWLLVCWSVLESFGYRQLNTWWRVKATWLVLIGRKPGWDRIQRTERFSDIQQAPRSDGGDGELGIMDIDDEAA